MSNTLTPIITQGGISALINANTRGFNARITHIGVGDGNGPYQASEAMRSLKNEIQRAIVAGGELRGAQQNQLHLSAILRDDGDNVPDVYSIYEIGFYLDDGTLFAVYASDGEKLAEKVFGTDFVLAFDLTLTGVNAGDVIVDGAADLQLPVAKDNLLTGENSIKIHTQAEFDKVFNQGEDTLIPANRTIVLSPIQNVDRLNDTGRWRKLARIDGFANSSENPQVRVTCFASNHGLTANDSIVIVENHYYPGTYRVSNVTPDHFDIDAAFVDSSVGTTALWVSNQAKGYRDITGFTPATGSEAQRQTRCDSAAHGLVTGDSILITESHYYKGVYTLSEPDSDSFDIDIPFVTADLAHGAAGEVGDNEHNTFNGRPAYVLKNSVRVSSNVSILGFNHQDTLVVKSQSDSKIKLLGQTDKPITGVHFSGWSFDGRGGVNTLGGNLTAIDNGGALYLEHVQDCQFDCNIVNHRTEGLGGGVYAQQNVTRIRANSIQFNQAQQGSGVYGCHESEFRLLDCEAQDCNHSIEYRQSSGADKQLLLRADLETKGHLYVSNGATFIGNTSFHSTHLTEFGRTRFKNTAGFDKAVSFIDEATFSGHVVFKQPTEFEQQVSFEAPIKLESSLESTESVTAKEITVNNGLTVGEALRIGDGLDDIAQPLVLKSASGFKPVGITQGNFGGDATLELTTIDGSDKQASRVCMRGGTDNADIEFLTGPRGSELVNMIIKGSSGYVGIGTSSPSCPLNIDVGASVFTPSYGFLNRGGPTGKQTASNTRDYSLLASHRIGASEFNAFSDERIKCIESTSEAQTDLDCLLKLEVTDYRYVDHHKYGDALKKGLIAQQVEEVFPQAVTHSQNVIPNIFCLSHRAEFCAENNTLQIYMPEPVELEEGDLVRLIHPELDVLNKAVLQISDDKTCFVINDWQCHVDEVFVYGKQVSDFRSIDFDRILVLCVSSLQEQQRQQQELAQENQILRDQLRQLQAEQAKVQKKIATLFSGLTKGGH